MRVAVIGAGVVGAAAGYELVRAGGDVVLADAMVDGRANRPERESFVRGRRGSMISIGSGSLSVAPSTIRRCWNPW